MVQVGAIYSVENTKNPLSLGLPQLVSNLVVALRKQ